MLNVNRLGSSEFLVYILVVYNGAGGTGYPNH